MSANLPGHIPAFLALGVLLILASPLVRAQDPEESLPQEEPAPQPAPGEAQPRAQAEDKSPEGQDDSLDDELDLLKEFSEIVTVATKSEITVRRSPAVVTVITRETLQSLGIRTLAEAFRFVPGFYDVYDLVTHNVGVRGVNGGSQAMGSIIKLMIDGHPVHFRPNTGNFFGSELIPLEVIERIEIIRGPASALYGANAFLGVVNVITSPRGALRGLRTSLDGGAIQNNFSWGGSLSIGGEGDNGAVSFLAAVQADFLERSGLTLPASSPIFQRKNLSIGLSDESSADESRPLSIFAKSSVGKEALGGEFSLMYSLQNLDADGAFQLFGPLSRSTRIAYLNQNLVLSYQRSPKEHLFFDLQLKAFRSEPSAKERLDLRRPGFVLLRNVEAEGYGVEGNAKWAPWAWLDLTVGGDFTDERHTLQTFDRLFTEDFVLSDESLLHSRGTRIPGEQAGAEKRLTNLGIFGQVIFEWSDSLSTTGGLRLDIPDLYGPQLTWRAALVLAPLDRPWFLKVLEGSSFKAPSAEQLFTQPMQAMDIKGNPELGAQRADTVEIVGGYEIGEKGSVSANVFLNRIDSRVEYVQRGSFLTAENLTDEWIAGGELLLDLNFLSKRLLVDLGLGLAKTLSTSYSAESVIQSTVEISQPLYPLFQGHLTLNYLIPWQELKVSVQSFYVGSRSASQSNIIEAGHEYSKAGYFLLGLAFSTPEFQWLGAKKTQFRAKIDNLLGTSYSEPGFGGVDLPGMGRSFFFTVVQER